MDRESLPREVQDQVDLESLEVRKTREGSLGIDRGAGAVLVDRLFERFWRVMREGETSE